MAESHRRRSEGRRGSGLILQAPAHLSEEQILRESLIRLTSVTKAITANIRNINENVDRILEDKADVEELEAILLFDCNSGWNENQHTQGAPRTRVEILYS